MSTSLVPVDLKKYPVLAPGSEAASLLRENLAGDSIGVGDLMRIRVPAGGGTAWSVPSIEGDKTEQSIEGVILHVARRRAYWASTDPSGDPPDCRSDDCMTGIGAPGGDCTTCPLNQFGSATKADGKPSRGKACKETRLLFVLQADSALPDIVIVPPGSLQPVKNYLVSLATKASVPYWAVVTRLKLSKVKNKDGISFAQIVPELAGRLDKASADAVRQYANGLLPVMNTVVVNAAEVDGEEQ